MLVRHNPNAHSVVMSDALLILGDHYCRDSIGFKLCSQKPFTESKYLLSKLYMKT